MRDQTRLLKRATLSVAAVLCVALPAGAADDLRLVEAAKQRDGQALRRLLEAPNVDVNAALPDGGTALHWAVHWDDLDMVDLLVRAGADVDAANDYGIVPLVLACTNGHTAIAERLLAAGANPNKVALVGEETVLMTAARTGVAGVVNALLDHGAEVDARDGHHGQTALMWAAAEGHEAVVRTLLARGAALDARSDATGFTPLLFAARTGDLDLMRVLLAAGADVDEAANDGTTALSIATLRSDTRLGEFLLAEGADPNRGAGFAPLHWAAGSWANIGDVDDGTRRSDADDWLKFEGLTAPAKHEFIKLLLDYGADPNARTERYPSGGRYGGGASGATPFQIAAQVGDLDTMRLLLEAGADSLVADAVGKTPMIAAAGPLRAGYSPVPERVALEAVMLTLELGNDVNAADLDGETALHAAAYRGLSGSESIVRLLVENGANLNAKNVWGWTPLTISEGIYFGNTDSRNDEMSALFRTLGAEPSPPDAERGAMRAIISVCNGGSSWGHRQRMCEQLLVRGDVR